MILLLLYDIIIKLSEYLPAIDKRHLKITNLLCCIIALKLMIVHVDRDGVASSNTF